MKELSLSDIATFHEHILASRKITLASHTHPDGDAIGSSLGMLGWLRSLGKDVVATFPDHIADTLKFIPSDEPILIYSEQKDKTEERLGESDMILCLDFNAFNRVEQMADTLSSSKAYKVLIDHHQNPDRESFDLCFSEIEISSASELAYQILKAMPEIGGDAKRLPASSARALMIGMTTDTNNFGNSTYPTTLQMASELLAAGVDRDSILVNVLQCYHESRLRILGELLYKRLIITKDGVAYMILDKGLAEKYQISDGDTEGFVNMPLTVSKVRMSIFLKEDGDHFRVSLRSKKGTSASEMARRFFSGGGHELASGGKLFIGKDIASARDAAAYVRQAADTFFGREGR